MSQNMKFNNYEWVNNPKTINIEQVKNVKEFQLPYIGSSLQNFGDEKRIVKGQGEFFGEDAKEQFSLLYNCYKNNDTGLLSIPGFESFNAVFKSIKVIYDATPNYISYNFEFWEKDISLYANDITTTPDYHIVKQGETLFDIAYKYDTTANELMKLNPTIKRPDELEVGSKVILK